MITIELPTEIITLQKKEYVNYHWIKQFKVYDKNGVFFIICNKGVRAQYAFKVLLNYASKKLEKQISARQNLKNHCDKLLVA